MKKTALPAVAAAGANPPANANLVHQLLGQSQMAQAFGQLSRTLLASKLHFVKENKLYQQLSGVTMPNGSSCDGTWEGFCTLLGISKDKADLDIANLRVFGEEALESMGRMGVGYRELRQYRRLPDDERAALVDAAKSGDKDSFLDLAETIIAKHAKQAEAQDERIRDLEANLADTTVQRDIAEATAEAAKKKLDAGMPRREDQLPQAMADLRAEVLACTKKAELAIDSFNAIGVDIFALGGSAAQPWVDGTMRLAAAGLCQLRMQLDGVLDKFAKELPALQGEAAEGTAYLTAQEAGEMAELFQRLIDVHPLEKAVREQERAKARPKGRGRPKADVVIPSELKR